MIEVWTGCGETGTLVPWGEKNGIVTMENSMAFPPKIKNFATWSSNHSLLGIYPKELKAEFRRICIRVFIAALFIIPKEKQSKCTSMDK